MSTLDLPLTRLPHKLQSVAAALLDGLSEKQIAARLHFSRHTVHTYVKAIYRFYGVSTRAEYMSLWIECPVPARFPEPLETSNAHAAANSQTQRQQRQGDIKVYIKTPV